jgi:hydroxymethylpyrimidine/phosphomethylpyrimidine kinase
VPGPDPRGTGCALASAIACELARRLELPLACERAIAWLDAARSRLVLGPEGRWHLAGE